jgi:DNA helicase MCM8
MSDVIDECTVESHKQVDTGKMDLQFNMKDLYGISDIAHEPDLFTLIVNSICPGIYGHEIVKGIHLECAILS